MIAEPTNEYNQYSIVLQWVFSVACEARRACGSALLSHCWDPALLWEPQAGLWRDPG